MVFVHIPLPALLVTVMKVIREQFVNVGHIHTTPGLCWVIVANTMLYYYNDNEKGVGGGGSNSVKSLPFFLVILARCIITLNLGFRCICFAYARSYALNIAWSSSCAV